MGVLDWFRGEVALGWDKVRGVAPVFCPIPWRPNALAPVFYGYQDFAPYQEVFAGIQSHIGERVLPLDIPAVRMRVLFPTLDGSPQYGRILAPCGRYPLIVFANGQCTDHPEAQGAHYLHWAAGSRLPSQLARAGYVVVVPSLPGSGVDAEGAGGQQMEILRDVISWMRSEWVHASLLAPPPATGLVGHSRGAVIAGLLAAEDNASAYVSLSGAWHDLADPTVVTTITVPKLFMRGTEESVDVDDFTWGQMSRPKHRVFIDKMEHFDYLYSGVAPCAGNSHLCECAPYVAADVATLFFGKYLPPPAVPSLPGRIEPSLMPPPLPLPGLTLQQEFYAGSYLTGFRCLTFADSPEACHTTLSWDTAASTGSLTRP
jgi:alpha/beta superfamily hydrolase